MKKLILIIILSICKISPLSAMSVSSLKKEVHKAEKQYGIPDGVLDAVITMESNYQISAVNPENFKKEVFVSSYGLGQLTFATAKAYCSLTKESALDPIKNIFCSAKVLQYQLKRFSGSLAHAVSAYNLGTPCVCDGVKYIRNLNNKIKSCQKYTTKKILYCSKSENGRFLNQDYVDKFFSTYKKLYPASKLVNI